MGIRKVFSSSGGLGSKAFSGGGPFSGKGLGNRTASEGVREIREDDKPEVPEVG